MLKTAADWPLLDMANSCVLKPNFCQLNNDFKPVQVKRISSRINFSYYIYLHTRLENRAFYHKVGIKQQCFCAYSEVVAKAQNGSKYIPELKSFMKFYLIHNYINIFFHNFGKIYVHRHLCTISLKIDEENTKKNHERAITCSRVIFLCILLQK
jgi:hypothetical protein